MQERLKSRLQQMTPEQKEWFRLNESAVLEKLQEHSQTVGSKTESVVSSGLLVTHGPLPPATCPSSQPTRLSTNTRATLLPAKLPVSVVKVWLHLAYCVSPSTYSYINYHLRAQTHKYIYLCKFPNPYILYLYNGYPSLHHHPHSLIILSKTRYL